MSKYSTNSVSLAKKFTAFGTFGVIAAVILIKTTLFTPSITAGFAFTQFPPSVRCFNGLPEVSLSWMSKANTNYYRVERRLASETIWPGVLDSQIKTTSYKDVLWAKDYGVTTYMYRIQAISNKAGNSNEYSDTVSIAVPDCRQPVKTAPLVSEKFVIGDRVAVRPDQPALNVRVAPAISAQVINKQTANMTGTVIDGPEFDTVDKYWFWQVDFDTGVDGWVVEYWVNKTTAPSPTTTTTPPASPTPTTTPTTTTPTTTPTTTTPTPTTQTPANKMPAGVKWGAYTGWSDESMTAFEQLTGKSPEMDMVFVHWGNESSFPMYYAKRIRDQGRTMVLFWEASDFTRPALQQPEYSLDAVLAGNFDNYFKNFAAGAKTYAGPIILIPYSEMNGNWYGWGGTVGSNSPSKVVAAYRYIHSFFADAPNVKFGWAPNANSVPNVTNNQMEAYYPGGDVVDYVGLDGFNFGGSAEQTFSQLFASPLTRLKQYGKPIMLFSMATSANSQKASWIKNAFTVELYKYPEVVGWLWFNENKERDWRVNSDPASLETFISVLP